MPVPTSGSMDYALSFRPEYHQAILDVIIHYGWKKVIYIYDSHDGESQSTLSSSSFHLYRWVLSVQLNSIGPFHWNRRRGHLQTANLIWGPHQLRLMDRKFYTWIWFISRVHLNTPDSNNEYVVECASGSIWKHLERAQALFKYWLIHLAVFV